MPRPQERCDIFVAGGGPAGTAHVTAAVVEFLAANAVAGRLEVLRQLAAIAKYHGPERRRPREESL